jgi:hypothetical protein
MFWVVLVRFGKHSKHMEEWSKYQAVLNREKAYKGLFFSNKYLEQRHKRKSLPSSTEKNSAVFS